MNLRKRFKGFNHNLSEGAKLFYYGTIGNAILALLDAGAHQQGGEGAVVNGIHNASDVIAYGIRAGVSEERLPAVNPEKILKSVNIMAILVTALVCAKNGINFFRPQASAHVADFGATLLSGGSSGGNFLIADALEPEEFDSTDDLSYQKSSKLQAHQDGHHHARADAWASSIATAGVAFTAATGNYRFDSIGTIVGGGYFIYHMVEHMRHGKLDDHKHHEHDSGHIDSDNL